MFAAAVSGTAPSVPDRITQPIDEARLVRLERNTHPNARPEFDRGAVDDGMPMEKIILLLRRSAEQQQAFDALVDELHNHNSPKFHRWLTPEEIGKTYGPSDADIATITTWLGSHGFKIDYVASGRTHIVFSGTAGQIKQAFHTEIHNYVVKGVHHVANATEPQIPAALSPVVSGFRSLHDFYPHPMYRNVGAFKRDPKTGGWINTNKIPSPPRAVDITYGSGGAYFVGPEDFYKIYNENPLLNNGITGAGVTIAVIEETDINPADVTTFRSQFNLPPYPGTPSSTLGGINYINGPTGCTDPGILTDGEEGEADIDAEWAGTTAPNAIVDFVSCASTASTAGIDLSASYIINSLANTVSAMSLSYGVCETFLTGSGAYAMFQADSYYNKLWEQASAEGQTVITSAGDSGSEVCDLDETVSTSYNTHGLQVSGMTSTPYNVSAGGTDFSDTFNGTNSTYWNTTASSTIPYASALSYVPETPWGSYCANPLFLEFAIINDGFPSTYTIPEFCTYLYTNVSTGYLALAGGSGGPSNCATGTPSTAGYVSGSCAGYPKPTWQAAYGVPADGVRDTPDWSFFAASGFWSHALAYCESDIDPCTYSDSTDGEALVAGGTSFVAPMIAGIMALVNQQTGSRQGQADYTLYAMAANEYGTASTPNSTNLANCNANNGNTINSSCVFYDIGPTANAAKGGTVAVAITEPCYETVADTFNCWNGGYTYGVSSTSTGSEVDAYAATAGYDYATGIGSANIYNLVNEWLSYGASFLTTNTLAANPTSIATSASTTLTASVATTGRGNNVAALGTVQFYIGSTSGTLLGSASLTAPACTGTAPNVTCSPSTASLVVQGTALSCGANNLIAHFLGDGANDAASTSSTETVTVTACATSGIYSPANGATLTGNSATFQWDAVGSATAYWLDLGSTLHGNNYFQSGNLGNVLTATVNGRLPTNGSTIYATLWAMIGGAWTVNSVYTYTAFNSAAGAAVLTTPAPSSTLTGSSAVFTWSAGTLATAYWIDVGSAAGGHQYYQSGNLGEVLTTKTVSGLPTNGSAIYVTLYSLIGGVWTYNSYTYTAFNAASAAGVLTTPAPSSILTANNVTFDWTAGTNASNYWLDVGNVAGGNQWYQSGNLGNVLTTTAPNLPANGSTLYATLYSYVGGQWVKNSYTYTAAPGAVITTPAPGSTVTGTSATFNWSAGTGFTSYNLTVGSTYGGSDIYSSGSITALTATVTTLPANSSTIYVTLYSVKTGETVQNYYSYSNP
jgi:hypothetical protein